MQDLNLQIKEEILKFILVEKGVDLKVSEEFPYLIYIPQQGSGQQIDVKINEEIIKFLVTDKGIDIKVTEELPYLLCLAQQGIPGPATDVLTVTLGEDVIRGQIVYQNEDLFYVASNDDSFLRTNPVNFFALALNDGLMGSEIQVRTSGLFYFSGSPLIQGNFYYLGLNGGLTTMPPIPGSDGLQLFVGQAYNVSDLLLSFKHPLRYPGIPNYRKLEYSKTDTSLSFGLIHHTSVIKEIKVVVQELFNDPSTQISVGVDGDEDLFVGPDELHPQRIDEYVFQCDFDIGALHVEPKIFINTTGSTGGGYASLMFVNT